MRRKGIFLLVFAALFVLAGCASETVPTPTIAPTATLAPQPAAASELFKMAYLNELPDYSFAPLELRGLDPKLTEWIRPVIPALIGPDNKVIGTSEIRGVGIICEKEGRNFVISASGPFQVVPAMNKEDEARGAVLGAVLAWDVAPGLVPEGIIKPNEILKIVMEDKEMGFVLLERVNPGGLPVPKDCPFELGDLSVLENLHKLIVVGHTKGDRPELLLQYLEASVRLVKQGKGVIYLDGSVSQHDWGSAVFYLVDGKPKLIGIVTGAYLQYGYETKIWGLGIQKIFDTIYEKTGIRLEGRDANDIP